MGGQGHSTGPNWSAFISFCPLGTKELSLIMSGDQTLWDIFLFIVEADEILIWCLV